VHSVSWHAPDLVGFLGLLIVVLHLTGLIIVRKSSQVRRNSTSGAIAPFATPRDSFACCPHRNLYYIKATTLYPGGIQSLDLCIAPDSSVASGGGTSRPRRQRAVFERILNRYRKTLRLATLAPCHAMGRICLGSKFLPQSPLEILADPQELS
jgi:hypothetical protein